MRRSSARPAHPRTQTTGTAALTSWPRMGGMTFSSDVLTGLKPKIRVSHPIFGELASATALACAYSGVNSPLANAGT